MNELKNNFLHVVRDNYFNFSGRARRREFWMYVLAVIILSIIVSIIDSVLFPNFMGESSLGSSGPLSSLLSLLLLIPGIAISVRRLHDTGRTGWWYLLVFVIIIGWIVLLIWFVQEGDEGTNKYGPDPKATEEFA